MAEKTDATADNAGEDLPHKPADDREEVYYDGSPLLRGDLGHLLLFSALGLLFIAGPIVASVMGYTAAWWGWVALILVGLLLALVPHILVRATRYRISNYRVDYERGLFSKRIDTLELWHVDDVNFYQSLLNRIVGVGEITIISDDATTPRLRMWGLPQPRPLFDSLKQRIIAVKRQRGVIKMDTGG